MKTKNKFLKGVAGPTLRREVRKLEKNAQKKTKRKIEKAVERQVEQVAEPAVKEKSVISKLANSLVGGLFGSGAGEAAGDIAGGIGKIFGFGDYEVEENSIVDGLVNVAKQAPEVPTMHSESDSVMIRHREMIGKVYSSINFHSTVYPIQPGESMSFPWGAAIFANYTKYKMHGLVYEFQSTTANGMSADVPALGDVMMATQYDNTDSMFVNSQQLMNHHFATAAEPSQNFMHAVECKPQLVQLNQYNIRTAPITNIQTINMYDMGYLTVATQGQRVDGIAIGNLWCTYEIELFVPRMAAALNLGGQYAHLISNTVSNVQGFFGTQGTVTSSFDSIGLTTKTNVATGQTDGILFPRGVMGTYLIEIMWHGTANPAQTQLATPTLTNCLIVTTDPFTNGNALALGHTTTYQYVSFAIRINDPEAIAQFTFPGVTDGNKFMTGTYQVDVVVTQINGNIAGTIAPSVSSFAMNAQHLAAIDPIRNKNLSKPVLTKDCICIREEEEKSDVELVDMRLPPPDVFRIDPLTKSVKYNGYKA